MFDTEGQPIVADYADEWDGLSRGERAALHLLNCLASHTGEVQVGPQVIRWALAVSLEEAVGTLMSLDEKGLIEVIIDGPMERPHYTYRIVGYVPLLRAIGEKRRTPFGATAATG